MTATDSTLTTLPTRPDSGHFNLTPIRIVLYLAGFVGAVGFAVIGFVVLSPLPLVTGFVLGTPRGGLLRWTRIMMRRDNRKARKRYQGDFFKSSTLDIEYKIEDETIAAQPRQFIPDVTFQSQPYNNGWASLLTTPATGHDSLVVEVRGGRFALAETAEQLAINRRLARSWVEATEGREEGVRLTYVYSQGPDPTMIARLANLAGALPEGMSLSDIGHPLVANVLDAFDTCYDGATRPFVGYVLSALRPENLVKKVEIPSDEFASLPLFDMARQVVAGARGAGYTGTGILGAMETAQYVHRSWDFDPEMLARYMKLAESERGIRDPRQSKTLLEAWPGKIDLGYDFIRIGKTFNRMLRFRRFTTPSVQPNHFAPLYHLGGICYSVAIPIDQMPAEQAAKVNNVETTFRRGKLRGRAKGKIEQPGDRDDLSEVEARAQRLHRERSPEQHFAPIMRITGASLKELNRIQEAVEGKLSDVNAQTAPVEGEALQFPGFLTALGLPML